MVIMSSCCFVIFSNPLQLLPYADPWLKGVSSCPVEGPKMALDSRVVVEQIFRTVSPSASPLSFPSSRGSFYSVLISLMFWFSPRIEFFASLLCPWFCPWLEGIFKGNFKIRKFFLAFSFHALKWNDRHPFHPEFHPEFRPWLEGVSQFDPRWLGVGSRAFPVRIEGSRWRIWGSPRLPFVPPLDSRGPFPCSVLLHHFLFLSKLDDTGIGFFEVDSIEKLIRSGPVFVLFGFALVYPTRRYLVARFPRFADVDVVSFAFVRRRLMSPQPIPSALAGHLKRNSVEVQ